VQATEIGIRMRGRPHIPFQDEDRLCPVPGLVAATRDRERERERQREREREREREKGQEGYLEVNHIEQRLVEEEALLAAPDVHIYHPLLLPGQTSGHTDRVQRLKPSSLPSSGPISLPGSRRIEIRGSNAGAFSHPERRDESLT